MARIRYVSEPNIFHSLLASLGAILFGVTIQFISLYFFDFLENVPFLPFFSGILFFSIVMSFFVYGFKGVR